MKYEGVIVQVQRAQGGITLIIETEIGLRGVDLDRELVNEILDDFGLAKADELTGWQVAYDPAHGDLDVLAPDDPDEKNAGGDTVEG